MFWLGKITQCGNFKIFLPLKFYVKSILGILEVQNLPFFDSFRGSAFWLFVNFCTFWSLELTKLTKLRVPKMAKNSIFRTPWYQKLISRKIWVTEKRRNFHTVQILCEIKMAVLQPKISAKLISHKILNGKKFSNFDTVSWQHWWKIGYFTYLIPKYVGENPAD